MTVAYVLMPGYITSRSDGQSHYVDARELARLYGVPREVCLVFPGGRTPDDEQRRRAIHERVARGELTALYPKSSGNYSLPR